MDDRLTAALERLSLEDAFRLMYSAYEYLRDLPGEVKSSTWPLLQRIRNGDADVVLHCTRKMLEEMEEVRQTLLGRHVHAGHSFRDTLINEVQQSLYWPGLLAVGRGVSFDSLRAAEFFRAGFEGQGVEKEPLIAGACSVAIVLRHALVRGGDALAQSRGRCTPPIEPREVPLADLRQMLQRDYLASFLEARLRSSG